MAFALSDLDQPTGSEILYRHGLVSGVRYTEGVQHLAQGAGAYWLIDKIATSQLDPVFEGQPFQVWTLTVTADAAVLSCEDGDGTVVSVEDIAFTDFPEPGITLWFTDGTILLPSEY